MTITTVFELNEIVKIVPLDMCEGRIVNFWISNRIEYKVRYFHGGELKEVYFLESELEKK